MKMTLNYFLTQKALKRTDLMVKIPTFPTAKHLVQPNLSGKNSMMWDVVDFSYCTVKSLRPVYFMHLILFQNI